MDLTQTLTQLDRRIVREIAKLTKARRVVRQLRHIQALAPAEPETNHVQAKRKMSAAGRRAISAAMKKRWADKRAAKTKAEK